jgi:hypothetical protein
MPDHVRAEVLGLKLGFTFSIVLLVSRLFFNVLPLHLSPTDAVPVTGKRSQSMSEFTLEAEDDLRGRFLGLSSLDPTPVMLSEGGVIVF